MAVRVAQPPCTAPRWPGRPGHPLLLPAFSRVQARPERPTRTALLAGGGKAAGAAAGAPARRPGPGATGARPGAPRPDGTRCARPAKPASPSCAARRAPPAAHTCAARRALEPQRVGRRLGAACARAGRRCAAPRVRGLGGPCRASLLLRCGAAGLWSAARAQARNCFQDTQNLPLSRSACMHAVRHGRRMLGSRPAIGSGMPAPYRMARLACGGKRCWDRHGWSLRRTHASAARPRPGPPPRQRCRSTHRRAPRRQTPRPRPRSRPCPAPPAASERWSPPRRPRLRAANAHGGVGGLAQCSEQTPCASRRTPSALCASYCCCTATADCWFTAPLRLLRARRR